MLYILSMHIYHKNVAPKRQVIELKAMIQYCHPQRHNAALIQYFHVQYGHCQDKENGISIHCRRFARCVSEVIPNMLKTQRYRQILYTI